MDKVKCQVCGEMAVWDYAPAGGKGNYCDNCVPRGCSCNLINPEEEEYEQQGELFFNISKGEEYKDDQGRLLPCIEYWYWEDGYDVD